MQRSRRAHPDLQLPALALHVKHHGRALLPAAHCGEGGGKEKRRCRYYHNNKLQLEAFGRADAEGTQQKPAHPTTTSARTRLAHNLHVAACVGPGQRDTAEPAVRQQRQLLQV